MRVEHVGKVAAIAKGEAESKGVAFEKESTLD